jgi:hypothetical protein
MQISARALITAVHGLLFGGFFILALFGLVVELIRSTYSAPHSDLSERGRSLASLYLWATAILGWAAVFAGVYMVYPWYRAIPPLGTTDFAAFPQHLLLASTATSRWNRLGMEWKEHVAWVAPIATTMAAYVMVNQRSAMKGYRQIRTAILAFALVAFASAGTAALFGAMINKQAPVNGGREIHLMSEP